MSATSNPTYHEGQDSIDEVRLFEVGPRDGLQNESVQVPTDAKIEMIERLVDAGMRDVEIGSFVHPKWVPQMADTARVAAGIRRVPGVRYWALVPNMKTDAWRVLVARSVWV